jgi:type IV pilus assembly protein PilY1
MKTHSNKTSALAFVLTLGLPAQGWAQLIEKKPNILFVIDTSGSMEYETGADTFPTCYPAEADPTQHTKSRWIEVLEVLTGTIDNYACAAEDRSTTAFLDEYAMPGTSVDPPDAFYRNPYHRPLSSSCAVTPFKDPPVSLLNAFEWDPPTEAPWPVSTTLPGSCVTSFSQAANGFIDTYTDVARFGLMTFDPLPDGDEGHSGASTYSPQYTGGVQGAWSYYVSGAAGETRPAEGKPADCEDPQELEVGVRNGAAPAAEGKMIYFGNQDLSASRDDDRHGRIEQVLLATRPYGATPLNGALDDVRAFFWYDSELEPTGVTGVGPTLYGTAVDGTRLSPRYDEYV